MAAGYLWPSTQTRLIRDIRELKNNAAWQEFVDLYGPLIFRVCRKWNLQQSDAEDVTQEVFRQVSRAISVFRYDPERGKFRSWLGTIATREAQRYLKKKKKSEQPLGGDNSSEIIDSLTLGDNSEWDDEFNTHIYETVLGLARDEFAPETWQAFDLVWIQGKAPSDVALLMTRKPEWVYKAKFNVLKRLKELVNELLSDGTFFD